LNLKQTLFKILKENDMIEETYPYVPIKDTLFFGFISEGINGDIFKIVMFTPIKNGKWNLGFGDWKNNDVDDKVMTNNHDVVKVIGTVAKITYDFFKEYPNTVLVIDPVDEKRKKLYNIVFQRHHQSIINNFKIIGKIQGQGKQIYSPKKIYDSFELSLKLK
jgi:methyltransferase-like protein